MSITDLNRLQSLLKVNDILRGIKKKETCKNMSPRMEDSSMGPGDVVDATKF
jgi:hypothetical protein